MKREFFKTLKEANSWGGVNIKIFPVPPFFPLEPSATVLGKKCPFKSWSFLLQMVTLLEGFKFFQPSSVAVAVFFWARLLCWRFFWVYSRKPVLPVDWSVASRKVKLLKQDSMQAELLVSLGIKKHFLLKKGKREKRGQC